MRYFIVHEHKGGRCGRAIYDVRARTKATRSKEQQRTQQAMSDATSDGTNMRQHAEQGARAREQNKQVARSNRVQHNARTAHLSKRVGAPSSEKHRATNKQTGETQAAMIVLTNHVTYCSATLEFQHHSPRVQDLA
eukprot:scaffold12017_cov120-Isochrysis_galbana.AAC.11